MAIGQLRNADWLDAARLRSYGFIFAALNLAALALLIATSRGGVDRFGHLLGTDFLSFWSASSLLHQGADVYDPALHIAEQHRIHAAPDGYMAFFYPPFFLLYCYPLAFLSYFPALLVWLGATGAAYAAAVRLWLGKVPWALAAFPAVFLAIAHGQSTFLAAALIGSGTWLLRSRPALAGVLFGLALFKPQFGLLIPLVLLVTGEWRAILAAAATAGALALVTTLAFGSQVWGDWLALSASATRAMENGAIGYAKMQSPFAAARLVGLSLPLAYGVQAIVGLGVAALLAAAAWRQRFSLEIGSALLAGALLTTPFVLDYDMILLAFPLAFLATRPVLLPWEKPVAALAFAMPLFARSLATALHIPTMVFIVLALFLLLIRRAMIARG